MAITVKNASGQVVSLNTDGARGKAVQEIVEQRIKRGELEKASASAKSAPTRRGRAAVIDADTGVKDKKGDLLKSVHGGGLDPDADGDVLGQPSGSKPVKDAVEVGGVSAAAVAQSQAEPATAPAKKAAAKRADNRS